MLRRMSQECSVEVFKLEHDAPEDFEQCMCQRESGLNLPYHGFLRLLYFHLVGMNVWGLVRLFLGCGYKYVLFFDFWVMLLNVFIMFFNYHGMSRLWRLEKEQSGALEEDYMPWDYRFYWAVYSAALPANMLSPIIFWSQVYTGKSPMFNIILNSVTPALILCQFLLVAFPLRFMHFYFFVVFYVVYIMFTLVYQKSGGTGVGGSIPIYSILDWRKLDVAFLAAFVGLALGVVLYFIFCLISMAKMWCRDKYLYSD